MNSRYKRSGGVEGINFKSKVGVRKRGKRVAYS